MQSLRHYICAVHVLFARSLDITSFVFLMLDSWKLDPSVCRAAVGN